MKIPIDEPKIGYGYKTSIIYIFAVGISKHPEFISKGVQNGIFMCNFRLLVQCAAAVKSLERRLWWSCLNNFFVSFKRAKQTAKRPGAGGV